MRKVAFVGFNQKSHEAIKTIADDVEIWSMNDAHNKDIAPTITRIDLLLEIHNQKLMVDVKFSSGINEKYEKHMKFLRTNTEIPVLMQEVNEDYPASVRYPKEKAMALNPGRKRFCSSFDWLAAYAILEKVDRVEVYGFEMSYHSTEYKYQKPSALRWLDRMRWEGIEVVIDPSCSLDANTKLYGYERSQMIPRHTIASQVNVYEKQMEGHLKNMYMWQAVLKERQTTKRGNVAEAAKHAGTYEINAAGCQAVVKVLNHLIDECDLDEDIL